MKISKDRLDALAQQWSGAYRGDYLGRPVSIEIIRALLAFGFTEWEAEQVYRSKHIRWFFDGNGDRVAKTKAFHLFTKYLKRNIDHIRLMFKTEMAHECLKG